MPHPVLNDLRLPVVAAPMFLVSGPELVIAASKAGVLGSFPAPNCRSTDELDRWLGTVTDGLTEGGVTKPWALNMVTHSSNPRLVEDLKVVAEHKPPVVITALGSPRPVMEVVKGYGGTVIADVVNLKLAHKAAEAGVDGLACVSSGSGGHTGHLNPFAFVSAVRNFFGGIVAVGGGIADGHGVAGAVATGADLVYVGTRFLATKESMAPDAYKQMVVDSGTDDLVVSAGITGTPASWLRPSLIENGLDPDNLIAPDKRAYGSGNGHTRWKDIWAAGQGIQVIKDAPATADVVDQLVEDYGMAMARLGRFRETPLV